MKFIPLSRGLWAIVDDEDYESLMVYKWHVLKISTGFYAARTKPRPDRGSVYMHHEVMGGKPSSGYETDHIDGSRLNNQKANLRNVTRSQNNMNRHHTCGVSKYKGVNWRKRVNKWRAAIGLDGKMRHLGLFESEEDAARAYDAAALEHFGEYSRLNFEVPV